MAKRPIGLCTCSRPVGAAFDLHLRLVRSLLVHLEALHLESKTVKEFKNPSLRLVFL